MAKAAVPLYLGQSFNDTPPGHRFTLYGSFWEPEQGWQRVKNIPPADLKKDFGQLAPETAKLRNALRARQAHITAALGEAIWTIKAQSIAPFVTGTGIEHPLENGMAFLNPYGLPYLPGSGVKGVVRRAAEELADGDWGDKQGWDQLTINVLFGREPKPGDTDEHTRGALIFWDVFPQCDRLAVDIMNPHYDDYYQRKTPPTDCGQPIPIFFLTVPENSGFTFHVQCDRARLPGDWPVDRWHTLLEAAFAHAFDWLGFGAKTAVGYGAMRRSDLPKIPPPTPSTPDNPQKAAPPVGEIKNSATTTPETGPQRWENVALFWNKGKRELNSTSAQGKAFVGGTEGANLREKLSVEQRSKLDKGKSITATLTVERIGGNNWRIIGIV